MKKFLLILGLCLVFSTVWAQKKSWDLSNVIITQISHNTFVHTSYLETNDFGKVPCNGLIVRSGSEIVIFDTPTDDAGSKTLIEWIENNLHAQIKMVIPTHFHNDCLGGLQAFHDKGINSIANQKTLELADVNQAVVPKQGFSQQTFLQVGADQVELRYFGPGHTQDNVVGYFAKEQVLFGGCLIKEMGASKGFLGDANLSEWSATVGKVKAAFPQVKWVIPGHGKVGDVSLLDYTIRLFLPSK
jgi:metallo-beta-lactamase class B